MGRMGRGWEMMKMGLGVVKSDKELLIFPILSMVLSAVIVLSYMGVTFFSFGFAGFTSAAGVIGLFLMYLVLYFLVIYFNVAVVGCAMIRYEGGDPTVRDGFRTANGKLGAIFKWAMVSATVGLILKALEQRGGIFGKIGAVIGGFAWSIATYFILPVLVFENAGTFGSVRRSLQIFRKTWGEAVVGGLGFLLIFFLLGILGIIPIFLGFYLGGINGIMVGVAIAFIYWVAIAAIASVAKTAFVTALYRYATTGKVAPGFSADAITTLGGSAAGVPGGAPEPYAGPKVGPVPTEKESGAGFDW